MPENKKLWCLDCEKEVELTKEGRCPIAACNLDLEAIYNRQKYERALRKLQNKLQAEEDAKNPPPKKDNPWW